MPALFHPVTRYTRLVLAGKRALWALAALLGLVIVAVAWFNSGSEGRIVFTGEMQLPQGPNSPPAMLNPRYQGLDGKNRPFNVIAERAFRLSKERVRLEKVSADMAMEDESWVALVAGEGEYDTAAEKLELFGGVELFLQDGYEFRTQAVSVDVKSGSAEGHLPVEGQGPAGALKAKRFKVLDHGAVLRFNDEVWVKLFL